MADDDLKQDLISSLESLCEKSPYAAKLKIIIDDLNKDDKFNNPLVEIPPRDYLNVIEFVLRLVQYMPGLLENNPNDEALKNLCIRCFQQMKLLEEIKKTQSFKK